MKKIVQVYMLPTNTVSSLGMNRDKLYFYDPAVYNEARHLYLTNDEEIKQGDWFLDISILTDRLIPSIAQAKSSTDLTFLNHPSKKPYIQKIIATTNPGLWYKDYPLGIRNRFAGIGVIPDSFIQSYIKAYNGGIPITQIMLEYYSTKNRDSDGASKYYYTETFLKLNSNGSVIWSLKEEKIYTRNEIIQILDAFGLVKFRQGLLHGDSVSAKTWFDATYPE